MFTKKGKGLLGFLLLFLIVGVEQAVAVSLSVVPSSSTASVGDTVRVDIYLDDMLEGELTSYRVELKLNSQTAENRVTT